MIKIGIIGYGNLGKGVELAISKQPDMEVFGVFSRRASASVKTAGANVYHIDELMNFKGQIDVLINCGSSGQDLSDQSPLLAEHFNLVDSYDVHAIIDEHIEKVNVVAEKVKTTALVSVGWDPGIFSAHKTIIESILPDGKTQSFWGYGISQGHSNMAKSIDGVLNARNYSVPNADNIASFKAGEVIDASQNHTKDLYLVIEDGADKERIKAEILAIDYYFKGSVVNFYFISEEEMVANHSQWIQAGEVIRVANTSDEIQHVLDFKMDLGSNPEFTASCLTAYARAVYNMHKRHEYGAFTALDIRPRDLSAKSFETLVKEML